MTTETICQQCIRHSGGCCTSVCLTIHKSEIQPFIEAEKKNNFPEGHTLEPWDEEKDLFVYKSAEDPCLFLGEDKQCTIYPNRPLICRMYPILWTREESFFVDLSCPYAHTIPLKEILTWPNEQKNHEQLKNMSQLEFNINKKQYAPISRLKENFTVLELLDKDGSNL